MIALSIILCVFLLLLLTPWRLYPWAIAATVPTYSWLYWVITRPLPTSDDWGALDRAIILIALFVGILPAFGRFLLARRSKMDSPPELDWKPTQASCAFVAVWGGAWLLTPAIPILIGNATSLAVGLLLSIAMFGAARYIRHNRVLFATAGTALITGVAAILIWPVAVVAAADQRAAGRPYCLVIAHGRNYRTANNLLDLTPLIMRGREDGRSASNFHGQILISGQSNRNWSYKYVDFFDTSSDNTPPHCVTRIRFARDLPWF